MKYIEKKDDCWHPINIEMPPTTTKVQVRDCHDNIYNNREIVVEMSGFYLYRREDPTGWENLSDYTEWRFA